MVGSDVFLAHAKANPTATGAEGTGKGLGVPRQAEKQSGRSMRGFSCRIVSAEVSSESRVNSDREENSARKPKEIPTLFKSRDVGWEFRQIQAVIRIIFLLALTIATGAAEPAGSPAESAGPLKVLHAVVSAKKEGRGTKKFLSGTTKIYGLWKGDALKAGDIVRAIWIAESFGYPQKDVNIAEGETTAYKPDDDGIFSLIRPPGGWPIGRYRLEFYVHDRLAETVRFAIEQDVTVEVR